LGKSKKTAKNLTLEKKKKKKKKKERKKEGRGEERKKIHTSSVGDPHEEVEKFWVKYLIIT
jgi:hypothetical protein